MPTIFENSAKYLFLDVLTEPLEVTPPAGTARTVRGHFNVEQAPSDSFGNAVDNQIITVDLQTSDCTGLVKKSSIKRTEKNETYYVIDPGVDISGIKTLTVSRKIGQ